MPQWQEIATADFHAEQAACLATGQPCTCPGTTHDPAKRARGLVYRAASGMLHSPIREIAPDGCRWCGAAQVGHGLRKVGKGPHLYEPPTPEQVAARERAGVIPGPECRCDPGDREADPCESEDCVIAFRMEVGWLG